MRYTVFGFALGATAVLLVAFQNCTSAGALRVTNRSSALSTERVRERLAAAVKTCADFYASEVTASLANGARLEGLTNRVARVQHVDAVVGSGNLVLLAGSGAIRPKVESIGDFAGNIYLCGVDVDRVDEEFRGNLVAVDSVVRGMNAAAANLTIVDGEVSPLNANFRGSLVTGNALGEGQGHSFSRAD